MSDASPLDEREDGWSPPGAEPVAGLPAALVRRLVHAVRASQNADDMFDEATVEFLGVGRTDGRCLDIVDRLGRVTAGRLAAESGLTTGAVTAVVDRLEKAGYLRRIRDTEDRRRVWIEATDRIRYFNRRLFSHLGEVMPALFERLTAREAELIAAFLEAGTFINRQRAELLREHLLPAEAGFEERRAEADAFAAEAGRLARCLGAQIRDGSLPGNFADPDAD